ncbi:MAG: hypothetical protein KY397_06800 [Gemmatimonadetes bacterium]|nr:hypothetical protein [Gemmatimonadota bacterium]
MNRPHPPVSRRNPPKSSSLKAPLRSALLAGLAAIAAGCDGGGPTGVESDAPRVVLSLAPAELALPAPPAGSEAVRIGFYLTTPHGAEIARADAAAAIGSTVAGASEILGACGLHLAVEGAGVVSVPGRLLTVDGNERGSWGGHPPDSVGDADAFMHEQDERLTAEARELFGSVRAGLPDNAIAAFVVRGIEFWIGEEQEPAAGLSFAPVIYHAEADYPLRNSVLLRSTAPLPGGSVRRLLAHELGHMLLNTGTHTGDEDNLMQSGESLTAEQCAVMGENLARLYGEERVVDPGLPGSS